MRRLPGLLAAAVVARMAFHAVFVPAFEGPDEPYHLARALAFATLPWPDAFAGAPVEPALVDSVRAKPCSENLHRVFGCPLFGGDAPAGRFDVLAPERASSVLAPGLVNTADDGPIETMKKPGLDGILGTADDETVTLNDFTRQIAITPLNLDGTATVNPNLRQVTVTIRYRVDRAWRTYTLVSYVSSYS